MNFKLAIIFHFLTTLYINISLSFSYAILCQGHNFFYESEALSRIKSNYSVTHTHTHSQIIILNSLKKFTRARRGEIDTVVAIKEIKPKNSERKLFYMKISLSLVIWWWDKRQLLNVLDSVFS